MGFDPRTLLLVHGVTFLTLGAIVFAFWRAHRTMPCLALWAGGVTLLGLRTVLIAARGVVPDFISIVIANSLGSAGAIVVWNGIRTFNAKPPRWTVALLMLPLLALALAYWTYGENELWPRVIIVNGTLGVAALMCAYELLRGGPRPLSRMTALAGVPFVLDVIAAAASMLWALLHQSTPNVMVAGGSILLLVPLVGSLLTSFGFIAITAERYYQQRSELEVQLLHSQKLEALGTLAGGIAHDINNMLLPILGLTKMMAARAPDGSRERGNFEIILKATDRIRDLVGQMLAFSRKDAADTREVVDLGGLVGDSLKMLRAGVPSTIAIEERLALVPPLLGAPGQLHQVIANLVTNAAHAIGAGTGRITVELATIDRRRMPNTKATARVICLSVSDTGRGMDKSTLARIFEPFFTTKGVGQGTGLGLSLVHGIVTQHGGRIEVTSQVGHGTRFDIYFPVLAEASASSLRALA